MSGTTDTPTGDNTLDHSTSPPGNRNQSVSSIEKLLAAHGLTSAMARFMNENFLNEEIDDPDNATKEQICTYMGEYLMAYRNNFYNEKLLREFRKDFNGWEFKQFNKVGTFKKDFRNLFEYQGVRVPHTTNDATAMVALLKGNDKGEQIEEWTEDEIKERIAADEFHPRAIMKFRYLSSITKGNPAQTFPKITIDKVTPSATLTHQDNVLPSTEHHAHSPPPETNDIPTVQDNDDFLFVPRKSTPLNPPQHQVQRSTTAVRQSSIVPNTLPFRQYTPIAPDTRFGTNVPHTAGNPDPFYWQLPPAEIRPEEPDVKLIRDFSKMYQESKKYTGDPYDLLDDKINIMLSICNRLKIPRTGFHAVFPLILKGRAEQYYISKIHPENSFTTMYSIMQTHFDTEINMTHYNTDWTNLTFESVKRANPTEDLQMVLAKMLDKLQLCQRAMKLVDPNDVHLRHQVLRATRQTPELRPVHYRPHPNYEVLCSEMRATLELALLTNPNDHNLIEDTKEDDPDAHYYDRRFSNNRSGQRSRFTSSSLRNNGNSNFRRNGRNFKGNESRNQTVKRCLICHKIGCWSTRHPKEDRGYIRNQYITDCERRDVEPDQKDFAAFLIDYEGLENWSDDDGEKAWREEPTQFLQQNIYRHMTRKGRIHQLTHIDIYNDPNEDLSPSHFILNQYDADIFHGIMPDTGAAKLSSAGKDQVQAYIRAFPGTTVDPSTAGHNRIKFGSGNPIVSLGTINVETIFGDIMFHVMPTPTPFLLSIADMDRLGIELHNTRNIIYQASTGKEATIVRKWGHPWFHFPPYEISSMFTETELRRLHRRFGHPETDRLYRLLTKAGHDDVDRSVLEQIAKFCHQCQMHSAVPRRFKFTLQDDREFNFEILADVMYLDQKPVLHVIDVGTSFQGATFLKEISAKVTWEALRRIWIDTYLGPPDIITHDAGTNFASKEFRSEAKIMGITCKEVPVEAHWSIGKLERYHQPLRRAWEIISTELHAKCSPQAMLQMAIKAVNDTAGPDGLVPTLLVFGAYPRISYDSPPSASTAQRAATMEKVMKALRQKTGERTVRDALNTRNGPNVSHILDLPLGSLVRVYREKKGWTGPFRVLSIENHDVTVETANGPSKFRTTVIQPYHDKDDEPVPDPELSDHDDLSEEEGDNIDDSDDFIPERDPEPTNAPVKRGRGRPKGSKNKPKIVINWQEAFVQFFPDPDCNETMLSEKEHHNMELAKQLRAEGKIDAPGNPFEMSDQTEVQNLIDNGVFAFERYDDKVHGDTRIFRSRMVREIKYDAVNKPYEKSRLVVQGYADEEKKEILTQSPTIQRASQRVILALAPSIRRLIEADVYLRDITQAYTQSKVPLIRKIYARLPKELNDKYPPNTIMLVIRPLYGLAEAGLLWFFTYHSHHLDVLKMNISTFDPCLLVTDPNRAEKNCFGIVGMQTDDTLFIGTPDFRDMENNALVYKAKDVSKLTTQSPLNFNGCRTSTDGISYLVKQKGQAKRLALIPTSEDNRKEFYVQQRARGAYIASICQPEASYDHSHAAQTIEPEETDCIELNKRLRWQIGNPDRGLKFVEIDLKTAAVYVFVDGSFANNKDLSSQIGYIVCLGNEKKINDSFVLKSNIMHWSSTKCKRVTRSVLASEIYGMVSGFDMGFCITQTINQILNSLCSTCDLSINAIPLVLCTDSYSLYEGITKLGTTAEKRLMIDIMALRQSYETKEITEIRWINGNDNPADAMTKSNPNKTLERMISTNEVTIRVEGMVTRKEKGIEK